MGGTITKPALTAVEGWSQNFGPNTKLALENCQVKSSTAVSCEVTTTPDPASSQTAVAPATTLPALTPPGGTLRATSLPSRLTGPALTGLHATTGITAPLATGVEASEHQAAAIGFMYQQAGVSQRVTLATGTDAEILANQTDIINREHLSKPPWSTALHNLWSERPRLREKFPTEEAFRAHFAKTLAEANMSAGRRTSPTTYAMPELNAVGIVALARGIIDAQVKAGKITPQQAEARYQFLTEIGYAASSVEGRSTAQTTRAAERAADSVTDNARRLGVQPPIGVRFNRREAVRALSASERESISLYERSPDAYGTNVEAPASQRGQERSARSRAANLIAGQQAVAASVRRRQDAEYVASVDARQALATAQRVTVRTAQVEGASVTRGDRVNLNRVV